MAKQRNEQWDAFIEIFEYEPVTQSEIKLWGKLTSSLKKAGATADSMKLVEREFKKEFPTASFTPTALEKHYSRYANRLRKKVIIKCPECGIGGGFHLADCTNKGEARG